MSAVISSIPTRRVTTGDSSTPLAPPSRHASIDPKSFDEDIEGIMASPEVAHTDPYLFRNALKSDEELATIKRRRKKGKALEAFYRKQNGLIISLLKPMDQHTQEAEDEEEAFRIPVKIAIYASLIANFCLCAIQLYAAITAASLSLLATGIDSVFDIGSNVMLFWIHRKAERLDVNKWPVGGARLENIGNAVYVFLMGSVNLIVVVESIQSIIARDTDKTFHIPSVVAVAAALGVKFGLFLYCLSIRRKSSQVEVLWEDHRNDLFINGFGLLMSCGGSKLRWYLDPLGAIIISFGVIIAWGQTVYRQFEHLAGKSAPYDFLQLVIYKAVTFSNDIKAVDTVRAYHIGQSYFVEVDVMMDPNTPLHKAHDISELLQNKIEVLPNVERTFVHVDHETKHRPEHVHRK
ncbi:hypothetical protein JAAARDRAFT_35605 [Jaapia argillacea MUCL 33604]|uniref:Uncharacterized protein n=1 Tax=Jaapia argillacea MUCL 33604 TaxID=933084 RepID=A0A067PT33_9AGAM|nr:hypothetical protein JAAARDRAFT_35605 [Jaapia argillacea MUCL 33604]